MVETSEPTKELKPAFDIIGSYLDAFVTVSDLYEPIDKDYTNNVYVTSSFDSLSHFEQDTNTVIELYEKLSGKPLDLNITDV